MKRRRNAPPRASRRLAKLYAEKLHDREHAAFYYQKHLEHLENREHALGGADAAEALQYLANYLKDSGRLREAEQYCRRLLQCSDSSQKQSAQALLKDVLSRSAQSTAK